MCKSLYIYLPWAYSQETTSKTCATKKKVIQKWEKLTQEPNGKISQDKDYANAIKGTPLVWKRRSKSTGKISPEKTVIELINYLIYKLFSQNRKLYWEIVYLEDVQIVIIIQ